MLGGPHDACQDLHTRGAKKAVLETIEPSPFCLLMEVLCVVADRLAGRDPFGPKVDPDAIDYRLFTIQGVVGV